MATPEPATAQPKAEEQQSIGTRVASLPLVSSAYDMVSSAYSSTKESHPYVRSVCDAAEKGVKTLTAAAVSGAQPLLTRLEPQSEWGAEGQHPTGAGSAPKLALAELRWCPALLLPLGQKDPAPAAPSGWREGDDGGKRGLEQPLELRKSSAKVPTKLATAVEGFEPEQQKQQQSYFVRLGSLSSKVQHRALQHSLGKLQSARHSSQDLLAQLQRALDLVEHLKQGVDQRLQGGQEKLQQMWLEWRMKQPGAATKDPAAPAAPAAPETVESGALAMLQGLAQQLQSSCQPLVLGLQGLPGSIQDTAGQVRHNVEGLRAALASAGSLQDLSGAVLARARAHATRARQLMDELVEKVASNPPLTWLVGPFAPSNERPVEIK
ncbi:PREDICTED: perilipin-3-like [Lepidothrix coronata]|uniref:Perilipin n=1 Tax=Lepidothrix coronata TaxID=321398 RepID=A0A6J0IR93_9PASS|nr:PREDICTED: perilipin-3-like [Lepidothrix coronata]